MSDTQTEALAIAAVRDWLNGGCSSWGLPSQQIETLLTALAAKDAELAVVKEMYAREGAKALYELERAERAEAQLAEARKALEPFAKIKPSTACAEDGSEAEPYRVFLAARDDFDFTGADLAAARRALEAQGGEDVL